MEAKRQYFRGDNDEVLDVAPTTILIPNDYKLKRCLLYTSRCV